MNSGGSRKTISSCYANISGGGKQIFPLLQETVYVWNRYNVTSDYETIWYPYLVYAGMVETTETYEDIEYYNRCTIWIVNSYDIVSYGNGEYRIRINSAMCIGQSICGYDYWVSGDDPTGTYTTYLNYGGEIWNAGDGAIGATYEYYVCYSYEEITQRGSYIGQVTSTSRNTYPNDGISGSYWYVYQGSK